MKTLNQYLLEQCCNFRCGLVLPYQKVPNNFCDITSVYNYSVPEDPGSEWKTPGGSLNSDENAAIMGAVGESLERYCAGVCDFETVKLNELVNETVIDLSEIALFSEEQYSDPGFAWKKPGAGDSLYCKAYSLYDNAETYLPYELVGLGARDKVAMPSTSTGIAAHSNTYEAVLSALLEVLERDALTVYWLNSLGGRQISLKKEYWDEVQRNGGEVFCFEITQAWNPFPVVVVGGHLLSQGKKRISLGAACRADYESAMKKAYYEWIQGCIFAGYYDEYHPDLLMEKKSDVNSFDKHAVYYTKKPHEWVSVPLLQKRKPYVYKETGYHKMNNEEKLRFLLRALKLEGIRLYYKDLTTPDVREAGLAVVRVVAPELSLLHGDENMPFLGGRTNDVKWRYKDIDGGEFPNSSPHPLG